MQSPKAELRDLYKQFLKSDRSRRRLTPTAREGAFRDWLRTREEVGSEELPEFAVRTRWPRKWLVFLWCMVVTAVAIPGLIGLVSEVRPSSRFEEAIIHPLLVGSLVALLLELTGLRGLSLLRWALILGVIALGVYGFAWPAMSITALIVFGSVALVALILVLIGQGVGVSFADKRPKRHLNELFRRWHGEDPGRKYMTRRRQEKGFRNWLNKYHRTWPTMPGFQVGPRIGMAIWRLLLAAAIAFLAWEVLIRFTGNASQAVLRLPVQDEYMLMTEAGLLFLMILLALATRDVVQLRTDSPLPMTEPASGVPLWRPAIPALGAPLPLLGGGSGSPAIESPVLDSGIAPPGGSFPASAAALPVWRPAIPVLGAALPLAASSAAAPAEPVAPAAEISPAWRPAIPALGAALPLLTGSLESESGPTPTPAPTATAAPLWRPSIPTAGAALPLVAASPSSASASGSLEDVNPTATAIPLWRPSIPACGAALPLLAPKQALPSSSNLNTVRIPTSVPLWRPTIPAAGTPLPLAQPPSAGAPAEPQGRGSEPPRTSPSIASTVTVPGVQPLKRIAPPSSGLGPSFGGRTPTFRLDNPGPDAE